ncbi:MAG: N-acetylneuraminate synthase [Verrucomicrobia bacterium]|nr:N-acetylneuraminate synthase [Verrucomicrobiota bacterium]
MEASPVNKQVVIGKTPIGEGHPCYIVFEAGPTHQGLQSAMRLCEYAHQAGANAIKFQILDPDRLVADRKIPFEYKILTQKNPEKTQTKTEPLYDLLKRRALKKSDWIKLKKHCDRIGIAFFATVAFPDEVEFLEAIQCHSIKIASADVNHFPLIRQAAKTGMCVQLDTGNSTLGEIEQAVDLLENSGNNKIIIHQCPSGYPARLDGINLRIISTLKAMFPYPVAFSDHTPSWEMDVAAVALGVNLVEKTITENRLTPSIEHLFSVEPSEAKEFVDKIRSVEKALGNTRRKMYPEELMKRDRIRRSAHLEKGGKKGQKLKSLSVVFRRPGFGMTPNQFDQWQESTLRKNLPVGHILRPQDIE